MRYVTAQGRLGLALERGVGYSDALDAANEVLALDPNHAYALTVRAIAGGRLHDYRQAVRDAERAIVLSPNDNSSFGRLMRQELLAWRRALGIPYLGGPLFRVGPSLNDILPSPRKRFPLAGRGEGADQDGG
jgi:tetratricopeptide (TPR) repeat protein